MTLHSALEDLRDTTLRAISGILRRLEYLGTLKRSEGGYSHWGLTRVHGDSAADKAMAQLHNKQLSQVLSTPLRDLLVDVERSSQSAGVPSKTYLERLRKQGVSLLPQETHAGSRRHLSSVLHALSILVTSPRAATRRDATPPRPLAQSLPPLGGIAGRAEPPATTDGAAG